MRERAEAATSGPWVAERVRSGPLLGVVVSAPTAPTQDATHIASWHPAVALAVADWLDLTFKQWTDDPGCDLGGGYDFARPCGACFRCAHYEAQIRGLTVARAYLGEGDDQ
jgi:hypothetical protein